MMAVSNRYLCLITPDSGGWYPCGSGHVMFLGRSSPGTVHGRDMYHEHRGLSSYGLSGGSTAASVRLVAAYICSPAGAGRRPRVATDVDLAIGRSALVPLPVEVETAISCVISFEALVISGSLCEVAPVGLDVGADATRSVVGSTSAPGAAMKRHVRTTRTVRSICMRIALVP